MPKSRSYQDKLIETLRDPEEAAGYLSAAFEGTDKELFLLALRNVADAQGGLSRLAEVTGLNRENLYRMLSDKGNPEFYSLITLLDALGLQLVVEPKQAASRPAVTTRVEGKVISFKPRRASIGLTAHRYALAADTKGKQSEAIVLTSEDGEDLGSLEYDYQNAELYVDLAVSLPDWPSIDVEIRTKNGNQIKSKFGHTKTGKLTLLQQTPVTKDQVAEVILSENISKG